MEYRSHSPLGAPAGEEGPLWVSRLLMAGLVCSGGAEGQVGLFSQRKLHHGGQVQLAAAGSKGGGEVLAQDDPPRHGGVQSCGEEEGLARELIKGAVGLAAQQGVLLVKNAGLDGKIREESRSTGEGEAGFLVS